MTDSRTGRPSRRTSGTPQSHYEYRVLTFPSSISRGDTRRALTEAAEYGRWELARSRLYAGGDRKVWLRRKVMRVRSTLDLVPDLD